jgi:hypothetical protein|tara:strand:- start:706 stop:1278 length:573 start_codon:yes stop_codon:yes gene_type:complete
MVFMSIGKILFSAFLATFGSSVQAATIESGTYAVEIEMVNLEWSCSASYGCAGSEPYFTSLYGLDPGDIVRGWMILELGDYGSRTAMSLSWPGQTLLWNNLSRVGAYSYYDPNNGQNLKLEKLGSLLQGRFERYDEAPWGYMASFDLRELAPVPLPASAALLPVGMGAIACLRRRRRRPRPRSAAGHSRP